MWQSPGWCRQGSSPLWEHLLLLPILRSCQNHMSSLAPTVWYISTVARNTGSHFHFQPAGGLSAKKRRGVGGEGWRAPSFTSPLLSSMPPSIQSYAHSGFLWIACKAEQGAETGSPFALWVLKHETGWFSSNQSFIED